MCPWLFFLAERRLLMDQLDGSVVIAMTVVGVVQMAVHQVASVVTVRNGFVATTGSVHMVGRMTAAVVMRRAAVRVFSRDFDGVMLDGSAFFLMMKVAVMQVVDMIAMLDSGMTAAFPVVVIVMIAMMTHDETPPM